MSYLVAHMEKFKKEAVSDIQSHNQRERKSKSNLDIESGRSHLNYDLYNSGPVNYAKIIDRRIDSLNLKKAPRSDAVQMCEVVVSSDDKALFKNLNASEQRHFYLTAKEWLAVLKRTNQRHTRLGKAKQSKQGPRKTIQGQLVLNGVRELCVALPTINGNCRIGIMGLLRPLCHPARPQGGDTYSRSLNV